MTQITMITTIVVIAHVISANIYIAVKVNARGVLTMDEYIEREAAYKDFEKCNSENPTWTPSRVKTLIARQKAADVAPVRPGRWEWFEDWHPSTSDSPIECEDYGWRCSECKTALEDMVYGIFDDPDDEPKMKFCPECGAKMDGGDQKC